MEARDLIERLDAIYGRTKPNILPFVGSAYTDPKSDDLRVMTIGLNAYVSAKDWDPGGGRPRPEWFASWFANQTHRFQRGVLKSASVLASALAAGPSCLGGRVFRGKESFLHTDGIKVYVHEDAGKRAGQLDAGMFERHTDQWHEELDLLAEAGVLPHLVVVFGRMYWPWAWRAFRKPPAGRYEHLRVFEFRNVPGPSHHFANRMTVAGAGGAQDALLVCLRHPAAQSKLGSAAWLLAQAEFRGLVGLPSSSTDHW